MKLQKDIFLFEAKDYLVSGEFFAVYWDREKSIGWTDFSETKELEKYYESSDYDSHKEKRKGPVGALYTVAQRIMFNSKWQLLRPYMSKKGKLLDFGAGTGAFMSFVKEKKTAVLGVELNENARKVCEDRGLAVEVSLESIDPNTTLQAITLWHVLEHMKAPLTLLKQMHNRLNPGGVLVIAVPNICAWDAKKYKAHWAALDVPRHLWHFSPNGLIDMVQNAGFVLIKKKPMWFDAFYVSFLSEKNKGSKASFIKGCLMGAYSNFLALFTKQPSSLMYVFKKRD